MFKQPHNAYCLLCGQRDPEKPCCLMFLAYAKKQYLFPNAESMKEAAKAPSIWPLKFLRSYRAENSQQNRLKMCFNFWSIRTTRPSRILWGMFISVIPEIFFYSDGEADNLYCNDEADDKNLAFGHLQFWRSKKKSWPTLESRKFSTKNAESIETKFPNLTANSSNTEVSL